MSTVHAGFCLCGSVRIRAHGALRGVVYCHCSQCRKQSGHYYAATNVPADELSIEGGETITWYAASDFAHRGFCSRCGSLLFWKADGAHEISVMAGLFETPTGLGQSCHIFVADKGDYYELPDDGLPRHERSTPSVPVAEEGPDRAASI